MNCPNCQAPVANGSLLCPNCGYHVATAYQRGKVNAMISGRPGVVKKSLRSGAFIFLAILMTIISVASLAVMVISIKDLIDTYNKFGSAIGGMTLLTTGITILFNILSFSLALASAITTWQLVGSNERTSQVDRLFSMGSYIGLQKFLAVLSAIFSILGIALIVICALLLNDLISDISAYIGMEGLELEELQALITEGQTYFWIAMAVISALVIWIVTAHARVFGKTRRSMRYLIGVMDPTSYKGKAWNLNKKTPMFGPCFFGFFYILGGLISIAAAVILGMLMNIPVVGEILKLFVGAEATIITYASAVINVALGLYLIVFAAYVRSVRRSLIAHDHALYVEQQNLAIIESNTAMEIRNIRIAQEHRQRQDEERRRQDEIRRRADEEEQRRMIMQAQEEQQQMMQQLMLSMTATNVSNQGAANSVAAMAQAINHSQAQPAAPEVAPVVEETVVVPVVEEAFEAPNVEETVFEAPVAEEAVVEAEVVEAEVAEAEVVEAEAVEAEVAEAEVVEAEVAEAEVVEAEAVEAEVAEAEVVETEAVEAEVAEAEVAQAEAVEAEVAEAEVAEAEAVEAEVAEAEVVEAEAVEAEVAEAEVAEAEAVEAEETSNEE